MSDQVANNVVYCNFDRPSQRVLIQKYRTFCLGSAFFGKIESTGCVCVLCGKRYLFLRNWFTRLCRASKFKICSVGYGEEFQFVPKSHLQIVFLLLRPSINWMKPTHYMEDNLLYLKSTTLYVNLVRKKIQRNTQNI